MNAIRYLGLIVVLLVMGCSGKDVPADIIQPHEMGNMLFEISMAEEFVNTYVARDTTKNRSAEIEK